MKVRAGPAKGTTLVLDLRANGSYWLGTYDNWILSRIRIEDWLPRGGVAWDCGAYVGYYTAIFRNVVGDAGQVIAFEASMLNYATLRELPMLNNWPNVQIINCAVGPDHGTLEFAGELGGASGPVDFKKFDHSIVTKRVACSGLDELCFEKGMPLPDFLKFDLEGAETVALHNGQRIFTEKRPILLLEIHGNRVLSSVGEFLSEYAYCGWDVRYFNQTGVGPFVNKDSLETAVGGLCNTMVCIPRELTEKRRRILGLC
jgi:methyltransferase, FkbM family